MNVIAIIGSREWKDFQRVEHYVDQLDINTVVITGGWWEGDHIRATRGVDRIAANRAKLRGLTVVLVAADYDRHGKAAGFRRNPVTVGLATRVVAFWDGKSNGTRDSIKHARRLLGREPEVITP